MELGYADDEEAADAEMPQLLGDDTSSDDDNASGAEVPHVQEDDTSSADSAVRAEHYEQKVGMTVSSVFTCFLI